jgi:hypothetical protein
MKIIFLDVDGVLNSNIKSYSEILISEFPYAVLQVELLELLVDIVKETNAKIVFSTSWVLFDKEFDDLKKELKKRDIKWLGSTPRKMSSTRTNEIVWGIEKFKPDQYVILDDLNLDFSSYDDLDVQRHFLKTTYEKGLTKDIAQKAIELLNE